MRMESLMEGRLYQALFTRIRSLASFQRQLESREEKYQAGRNINSLIYVDDITLTAESERN